MIDLVKTVAGKMKGFSRRETVEYYKDIVQRAWAQVEAAETPEVKSEKYAETMEWTMLDKDYDDRTRRTFQGGPVFVPTWWGRYDPTFPSSAPASSGPVSAPSYPLRKAAYRCLPCRDRPLLHRSCAAWRISPATWSATSANFTSAVTNKTNPVPVSTSSGRSPAGGAAVGAAPALAPAQVAPAPAPVEAGRLMASLQALDPPGKSLAERGPARSPGRLPAPRAVSLPAPAGGRAQPDPPAHRPGPAGCCWSTPAG